MWIFGGRIFLVWKFMIKGFKLEVCMVLFKNNKEVSVVSRSWGLRRNIEG